MWLNLNGKVSLKLCMQSTLNARLFTVVSASEVKLRDDRRTQPLRFRTKVVVDGKSHKTKDVFDNLNPSWNETLTM